MTAPLTDPETIRRLTHETVNRPEFPASSPDTQNSLKALAAFLERIFAAISLWSAANPVWAWVVFGILLGLLILLVIHIIRVGLQSTGGRSAAGDLRARARWAMLEGAGNSWQEGLRSAFEALERGELRRAVWIAHRVLLGLLDEQGAITFAGFKTNAAYVQECAPQHPFFPTLQALTEVYERVIYADQPVASATLLELLYRLQAHGQAGGQGRVASEGTPAEKTASPGAGGPGGA